MAISAKQQEIANIASTLKNPRAFCREYRDCIRAVQAVIDNKPLTRAAKNRELKKLSELKSKKSISKRYEKLDELTKDHIFLIVDLKNCSFSEACKFISNETQTRTRDDYFYIEGRLAVAFISNEGKITEYEKGDFAKILRQLRIDCNKIELNNLDTRSHNIAPYSQSLLETRIRQLREYARNLLGKDFKCFLRDLKNADIRRRLRDASIRRRLRGVSIRSKLKDTRHRPKDTDIKRRPKEAGIRRRLQGTAKRRRPKDTGIMRRLKEKTSCPCSESQLGSCPFQVTSLGASKNAQAPR